MRHEQPGLSVVVPVFNSAESLPRLVERLKPVLDSCVGEAELVLVNDDSRDASWSVIQELAQRNPWVRGLCLARNCGQHNALLCGIREAKYDLIVTMDDDLQNPPEAIPQLLDKLREGFDVVYGTPERQQYGFPRAVASRITKFVLQNVMGSETARSASTFRAIRTRLRDSFADYAGPFVSIDVLLAWGTRRFAAVRVRHDARLCGASQYTFLKLLTHAWNMTTGFTVIPLQLASWIGFMLTLFGVGVFGYVAGRYFIVGGRVPGLPFLASIIAIFAGIQLFALGVIGEYLARMYQRIMRYPGYVVSGRTGTES